MDKTFSIKIGLLSYDAAWEMLLEQIGVNWCVIENPTDCTPNSYSTVIINRSISLAERDVLSRYAETGGAILYTTAEQQEVAKKSSRYRYFKSTAPRVDTTYHFFEIFDVYGKVYCFEKDSFIKVEQIKNGLKSFLGINVYPIMIDSHATRKNFYSNTSRYPNERVARSSKNALRQLIQSHLEYLHHKRKLPFVHKWFYPEKHLTVFTFRIDSDKGTQDQIEELFLLLEQHKIPATWFLDVKSHEGWLPYFKKFIKQEIGVHCYEHTVYSNALMNKENFEKARILLNNHDISIKGIAAPTGHWSTAVGRAIQELQFDYSSEFAFDYDNLPLFPLVKGLFSPVVQLPVHPICIGTMIRERMTAEEMIRYYTDIITRKLATNEPICLYHHPGHRHNEVFNEVFCYINSKNILKLTYTDYSAWWKRRHNLKFIALWDGQNLHCESSSINDVWLRISVTGKEIITAPSTTVELVSQTFNSTKNIYEIHDDIIKTRTWTPRNYVQNFLDWWIKITE